MLISVVKFPVGAQPVRYTVPRKGTVAGARLHQTVLHTSNGAHMHLVSFAEESSIGEHAYSTADAHHTEEAP